MDESIDESSPSGEEHTQTADGHTRDRGNGVSAAGALTCFVLICADVARAD